MSRASCLARRLAAQKDFFDVPSREAIVYRGNGPANFRQQSAKWIVLKRFDRQAGRAHEHHRVAIEHSQVGFLGQQVDQEPQLFLFPRLGTAQQRGRGAGRRSIVGLRFAPWQVISISAISSGEMAAASTVS